jgi:ADP-ribosylglycohydrolase
MAMAIVENIAEHRRIDADSLAKRFLERYRQDPGRGYGKGVRLQFEAIERGASWVDTSKGAFSGRGSMGNGAAMRAAPVGAYFSDDTAEVVKHAVEASRITHAHPEGIAGGIAVALAAAAAWNTHDSDIDQARQSVWDAVLRGTPNGETAQGLRKASAMPLSVDPAFAAHMLGSGFLVTSADTVPFAMWCAIRHLGDYREAMICTLEGDGDCDTNCAIVGGIVSLRTGLAGIPENWLRNREPLDLRV